MKKQLFEHLGGNQFRLKEYNLPTHETTIVDPGTNQPVDVTVEYDYTPASKGERERGTGVPLSPDNPASVEILSVKDSSGIEYDLTNDQMYELEQEILDNLSNQGSDEKFDNMDR